jgi:hypothetical protein
MPDFLFNKTFGVVFIHSFVVSKSIAVMRYFTICILIMGHLSLMGQIKDITIIPQKKQTIYNAENEGNNNIWGNSWYVATSYSHSKANEFDLNIGRTFELVKGNLFKLRSWGMGYEIAKTHKVTKEFSKAFCEYTLFLRPPMSIGIRGDYMYNITDKQHYLRPSAGLSFVFFDVLYSYSFNLSDGENIIKHAITFRLKYFFNPSNWEKHYVVKPRVIQ